MSFFTSEYDCKLDAKGRLTLPARIKMGLPEVSNGEIVIRRGFEPCLVLYPLVEYKKIYAKIAGLNEFNEEYRHLQRNFFRGNAVAELDKVGRLLLPRSMMNYASLDREVTVVGLGNRVEVWSPEQYEKYLIQDPSELSALAQKYLDEQ
ncbi:division/cell wall cluster transcriptional repressor MraZ [Xanthovirga aplysinae]|uniref:division/cell wall cluster transcriptional repressor MraZ n=1 Tax=Xanthovirga aplysinae TaxID=2529853 RepID=UPI0012BBAB00|nr:division/cell wall cluster transcriptional repressor MraZ [Xanthovirga aplysinae]MTI32866.1 division/cell wall cluster transcriptional repressor MraZ [Xanthovirga aplysinae]